MRYQISKAGFWAVRRGRVLRTRIVVLVRRWQGEGKGLVEMIDFVKFLFSCHVFGACFSGAAVLI